MILGIDHVGIAVDDLEAAVDRYRRSLGIEPTHRERMEEQGVDEVLFPLGGSFVQLLGALGPETPVGIFLAKRGPGVHHVAYVVDDLAGELERMRADEIRLIDEAPRRGSRGTSIAFVHPKDLEGVLVELVELP
ncbi:MAG TPA: methylmalonyl-CoA epimerase [Actinomycetota bacterium]|nr:methylmalonyl-CoA epimerase [Actinomycetota bacterium]